MATAYDTWKTDVPCDPRSEWIADRTGDLVMQRMADRKRVASALEDAMANDYEGTFAGLLSEFMLSADPEANQKLLLSLIRIAAPIVAEEADTDAELEWESRHVGVPE
jgi:hypothetical protein